MAAPDSTKGLSRSAAGLTDDEDYVISSAEEGSGGSGDEGSGSGSGTSEDVPSFDRQTGQTRKEATISDLEPCRGYLFKASTPEWGPQTSECRLISLRYLEGSKHIR